tara:strand:+ start:12111 stop:12797 length:687 start_codon:yes stop_codon:yes gene_type:complete
MAGSIDKIELVQFFFKSFNKNPDKESYLVNFFLQELQNYTDREVDKGINSLITGGKHNYLPKAWELVQHIEADLEVSEPSAIPCFICGSHGYVFGVIGIGPGGKTRPMSINCKPVKGYHYQSTVMGRCNCLNGQRLSPLIKQVEPLADIVAVAKSEDYDCVYISDRWAGRLNGKPDTVPTPEVINTVNKLIKRSQERHNNNRASEPESASELFAKEVDALNVGVNNAI